MATLVDVRSTTLPPSSTLPATLLYENESRKACSKVKQQPRVPPQPVTRLSLQGASLSVFQILVLGPTSAPREKLLSPFYNPGKGGTEAP